MQLPVMFTIFGKKKYFVFWKTTQNTKYFQKVTKIQVQNTLQQQYFNYKYKYFTSILNSI